MTLNPFLFYHPHPDLSPSREREVAEIQRLLDRSFTPATNMVHVLAMPWIDRTDQQAMFHRSGVNGFCHCNHER